MVTTKGEFATPLFLLNYLPYICGMTIMLVLIFIVLLGINKNVRNLSNKK